MCYLVYINLNIIVNVLFTIIISPEKSSVNPFFKKIVYFFLYIIMAAESAAFDRLIRP